MVPVTALYHEALRMTASMTPGELLSILLNKTGEHWLEEANRRHLMQYDCLGLFQVESSSGVKWPAIAVRAWRVDRNGKADRTVQLVIFPAAIHDVSTETYSLGEYIAHRLSTIDWTMFMGDKAPSKITLGTNPERGPKLRELGERWEMKKPPKQQA